jgi:hypothetical protein
MLAAMTAATMLAVMIPAAMPTSKNSC